MVSFNSACVAASWRTIAKSGDPARRSKCWFHSARPASPSADESAAEIFSESETATRVFERNTTEIGFSFADALRSNTFHLPRSEEHTSELQSHSFISYAVF